MHFCDGQKMNDQLILEQLCSTLSQDELNSILLKLFEKKSANVSATSAIHQYENNRFTKPSKIDQRLLNFFDYLAFSLLPEQFETIELSPVTIFGLNRLLTPISQKNILATIRKSEVVSDVATALVPEIVKKIRAKKNQNNHYIQKISSSHRCLRLQNFSNNPEFTAHFRVFSLGTAWHVANKKAIFNNIYEHLSFYLSLLVKAKANNFNISSIQVAISHMPFIESVLNKHGIDKKYIQSKTQDNAFSYIQFYQLTHPEYLNEADELLDYFQNESENPWLFELLAVWENVVILLKEKFPEVHFFIDLQRIAGIGYYNGICFKVSAENEKGKHYPLIDGGVTNWIDTLMQSKNFKLLTSCIGSELFCRFFYSD